MMTPRGRLALIGPESLRRGVYAPALRRLGVRPWLNSEADQPLNLEEVDAVVLAAPGPGTKALLARLERARKPLLCPPAMSEMIGSSWPGLFTGSHLRFAAAAEQVRTCLAAGELGRPLTLTAAVGGPPPPHASQADFWDRSVSGGGALLDPGGDVLDLLGWWFGPLTPVRLSDDSRRGVEAEARVSIRTAQGPGDLEFSRLRRLENTIELNGPHGRIVFDLERYSTRVETDRHVRGATGAGETLVELHARRIAAWLETRWSVAALARVETGRLLSGLYMRRERLLQPWETPLAGACLRGRKVLVAGATGFIGARLVEELAGAGAEVTAVVRNFRRAGRIARFAVNLRQQDFCRPADAAALVEGHEVAFNLAYDVRRSGDENLSAYQALANACAQAGVKRFVQASSIVVYDGWPKDPLTEGSAKSPSGHEYKRAKRLMELDLLARTAAGEFEAVILQPTIVYGPFSTLWTDDLVERLQAGGVALPEEGVCNGVYVDDVVQALLAAACAPDVDGESFIVSGPAPFRWLDLVRGYASAAGGEVRAEPKTDASAMRAAGPLQRMLSDPLSLASSPAARRVLALVRDRLGSDRMERLRDRVTVARGSTVSRPAQVEPALYLTRATCSIEKLTATLGPPRTSPAEGIALTQAYIRWRLQRHLAGSM